MQEEIQSLPRNQQLTQQGRFCVYYVDAGQAPLLVREIGRLREITFREVGEGTGRPIDLDRFDAHYRHLFLWNDEHAELEEDGKGLPVLLRQYLKLGATLLCFNLDPSFADVVDGLVFLDLTRSAAPMIKRVMGSEGYRQFGRFHGLQPETPPRFRKAG